MGPRGIFAHPKRTKDERRSRTARHGLPVYPASRATGVDGIYDTPPPSQLDEGDEEEKGRGGENREK